MKFAFNVNNCVVEVSVSEVQTINDKYRPQLRGEVFPFAAHFHSVKFEVNDDETSIGFGGNTFRNGMGAKIVQAAIVAQEQVAHFSSLLEELRSSKGDPRDVLRVMKQGDHAMAAIMLSMIPDSTEEMLARGILSKLPENTKANSVLTAVMLEPSFKTAIKLLDNSTAEVRELCEKDMAAYQFANYVRGLFASTLPQVELKAQESGEKRAAYVTSKMKEFIGE
ncbi:TPA: hypothetical protein ACSCYS_004533 [Aeromonas veronii]|nr:hypothetical protein [Aeromonas veronii]